MTCLKCGRETDQTFCAECRAVMEKYPVKPGTIVQIPKERRSTAPKRKPLRWPTANPETQIANMKKTIRSLWIVIITQLVLLAVMGGVLYRIVTIRQTRPVGQNYSTVTQSTGESTTEEPTETEEPVPESE